MAFHRNQTLSLGLAGSSRNSGFSLLEVIAAIGIGAMIIAGGLALFGHASSGQSANQINSALPSVRLGVQNLFSGRGTYFPDGSASGSLLSVLDTNEVLPSNWSYSGAGNADLPNGVEADVVGGADAFVIAMGPLATATCQSVLQAEATQGWREIAVTTGDPSTPSPGGVSSEPEFDRAGSRVTGIAPDDAQSLCSSGSAQVQFVSE